MSHLISEPPPAALPTPPPPPSQCEFGEAEISGDRKRWTCLICGKPTKWLPSFAESHERRCGVQEFKSAKELPGTELTNLIESLGLSSVKACGCKRMARRMNRLGVEWCKANRAEIVAHLRKSATWAGTFVGAVNSLGAKWLNILDPLGSLVDEAVRRAIAA